MLCLADSLCHIDPSLQPLRKAVGEAPTLAQMILAAWRLARVLAVQIVEDELAARAQRPTQWPCCPRCGTPLHSKGFVLRQVDSLLGCIHWRRRVGRCPRRCGIGQVAPLDAALGLAAHQHTSGELQQAGCALAIFIPFDETVAALLQLLNGIRVSPGAVWRWVQAAGQQAMARLQQELDALATGQAPGEEPLDAQTAAQPLLIGADGVLVPFRPAAGTPKGHTVEWAPFSQTVEFWNGQRFVSLDELTPLSPDQARAFRALLGRIAALPDAEIAAWDNRSLAEWLAQHVAQPALRQVFTTLGMIMTTIPRAIDMAAGEVLYIARDNLNQTRQVLQASYPLDGMAGLTQGLVSAITAHGGEVAVEYGITREMQDEWAAQSHARWFAAQAAGKYQVGQELMSVTIPQRRGDPIVLDRDEPPRENVSVEQMARLRTIYGSPTVTAGNAPGLNAGASAMVIMSRHKAARLGLPPLATIAACQAAAGAPTYMARVPAQAIARLLDQTGRALADVDLIEINEAFAAVTLVSLHDLAGGDPAEFQALQARTNVNGGAIAIGHPVGASGARITMTLMYELQRRGGGVGVAAICGGLAQGEAILITV